MEKRYILENIKVLESIEVLKQSSHHIKLTLELEHQRAPPWPFSYKILKNSFCF